MIQDIAPLHLYNEWHNVQPEKDDWVICMQERKILVRGVQNAICFPRYAEIKSQVQNGDRFVYLFAVGEERFFLYQQHQYKDREELIRHYRKDLDYAARMGAEYVVFHVVQVDDEEGVTYEKKHRDREVIDAAAAFINELLDGQKYSFWFLMENLWWPGLTFLHPEDTRALMEQVRYEKKGFMLDTGHYLHTNLDLQTQDEAVEYLHGMLDKQEDMIPYIKGIHLQQSLTGDYVKQWLSMPHELPEDPAERFRAVYEHIFRIDRHEPFTAPGVTALVERIDPLYVTYEYITRNREELAEYLDIGNRALQRKNNKIC